MLKIFNFFGAGKEKLYEENINLFHVPEFIKRVFSSVLNALTATKLLERWIEITFNLVKMNWLDAMKSESISQAWTG